MHITEFESLLERPEGKTIDFKQCRYDFSGGERDKKRAEFVKDVIAMWNTPRKEPSFIILGVKAPTDGSKELCGIDTHIDDAELRDKFNNLVNPLPDFEYHPINYNNKSFAVIEIPVTTKIGPCLPTKDSGHRTLLENQVYCRRGSTNVTANHQEQVEIYKWFSPEPSSTNALAQLEPFDFSSVIEEKCKDFSGREWFLDQIAARQAHSEEKSFLITGGMGTGKSALAAQMIRNPRPDIYIVAYHFCLPTEPVTHSPMCLVKNVAAMAVNELATVDRPKADEHLKRLNNLLGKYDSATIWSQGILRILKELPHSETMRYILIDGLDETIKVSGIADKALIHLLPVFVKMLPEGVRLITTTQSTPEILTLFGDSARLALDGPEHSRDIEDDIGTFIKRRLNNPNLEERLTQAHQTKEAVVKRLIESSENVFSYVTLALDAVKSGHIDLRDLGKAFPPGMTRLLHCLFKRIFPNKFKKARSVLEVCLAIQSVSEEAQIADVLPELNVKKQMKRLAPVFRKSESPTGAAYSFVHDWVKQWLANRVTNEEFCCDPKQGHSRIANCGWTKYKDECDELSNYYLEYLPIHLLEADRIEDLCELLTDLSFLQTRLHNGKFARARSDCEQVLDTELQTRGQVTIETLREIPKDFPVPTRSWQAKVNNHLESNRQERLQASAFGKLAKQINIVKEMAAFLSDYHEILIRYPSDLPALAGSSGLARLADQGKSRIGNAPWIERINVPDISPQFIYKIEGQCFRYRGIDVCSDGALWRVRTGRGSSPRLSFKNLETEEIRHAPHIGDRTSFIRVSPTGACVLVGRLYPKATDIDYLDEAEFEDRWKAQAYSESHLVAYSTVNFGEEIDLPDAYTEAEVVDAAFCADESKLLVGLYDRVILWEMGTRKDRALWQCSEDRPSPPIVSVALSLDGGLAVAATTDEVHAWDVAHGRCERRATFLIERYCNNRRVGILNIQWIVLAPNCKKVFVFGPSFSFGDFTAIVLDSTDLREESRFNVGKELSSIALSHDGEMLVIGGENQRVRVFDSTSGNEVDADGDGNDAAGAIWRCDMAFSRDGRNAVYLNGPIDLYSSCRHWSLVEERPATRKVTSLEMKRHSAQNHYDRRCRSTSSTHSFLQAEVRACREGVHLWSLGGSWGDPGFIRLLQGRFGPMATSRFTQDGSRVLSLSESGELIVWDVATGKYKLLSRLQIPTYDAVRCEIHPSPDGSWAFVTSPSCGAKAVWFGPSGTEEIVVDCPIACFAYSPNGNLLVFGTNSGELSIIRIEKSKFAQKKMRESMLGMAFLKVLPDGQYLIAAAIHGELRLIDLNSDRIIARYHARDGISAISEVGVDGTLSCTDGNKKNHSLRINNLSTGIARVVPVRMFRFKGDILNSRREVQRVEAVNVWRGTKHSEWRDLLKLLIKNEYDENARWFWDQCSELDRKVIVAPNKDRRLSSHKIGTFRRLRRAIRIVSQKVKEMYRGKEEFIQQWLQLNNINLFEPTKAGGSIPLTTRAEKLPGESDLESTLACPQCNHWWTALVSTALTMNCPKCGIKIQVEEAL